MIKQQGTYKIIFGDGIVGIVPLSKCSKLKEPTIYPNPQLPKYVINYIEQKLRYIGFVYLTHADEPIGNPNKPTGLAQHYMGFAKDVDKRMLRHINGQGAAIMRAFAKQKIKVHIVRLWVGDRHYERQLKRQHNRKRFCPVCKGGLV